MKISYSNIITLSLILLSTIIFCNMNGMLYMLYGIKAPLSIVILFLSGVIIYLGLFKMKIRIKSNLLILAFVFYLSYLIIGISVYLIGSPEIHPEISHFSLSKGYLSSLIIFLAYYIGTKNLVLEGRLKFLLIALPILLFVSVGITILAPVIGLTNAYEYAKGVVTEGNRQSGLFGNPNEAGMFACYFIVVLLACYSFFRKYAWTFLLLVPFGLYMAFTSFSKSAMIMGILLFPFYIVFNLKHFNKLKVSNFFKSALFVGLFLAFFLFALREITSRLENMSHVQRTRIFHTILLFSGQIDERTTSDRSTVYAFVWGEIQKNPISGYGLGVFHKTMRLPGPHKLGPHNTHLLVFAESGFIPILLFVLLYFSLIYAGWKHPIPGIGFLIMGVCIVYFFGLAGTGHTALDNRTSNALVGILFVLYNIRPEIQSSERKRAKLQASES